jgi:DNA-binding transcriptional MerR regulator
MVTAIDREFTAGQAARLTGAAYKNMDYWARTGLLTPSIADATGTGSQRRYSFGDLIALKVVVRLRAAGISLQGLRRVAQYLQGRIPAASFADVYLVSDGIDVFEKRGHELISTLRQPGQVAFAWIVDVGAVVEELEAALAA